MMKKILLGGILGGLAMFVWSSVAHMALPIGEMGVKVMPNEDAVMAAMKSNLSEPGFYFFPGEGAMHSVSGASEQQKAAQEAWLKKYEAGPRGVLVYHPTGESPVSPRQLVGELASDIVAVIIVAFALSFALGGLRTTASRIGFVTLLGLLPWVVVDFSYMNWYGFPAALEVAEFLDQIIGMALAGVVLAFVFRRS
jgi:hypothetical protein